MKQQLYSFMKFLFRFFSLLLRGLVKALDFFFLFCYLLFDSVSDLKKQKNRRAFYFLFYFFWKANKREGGETGSH